jgi:hypothetical protein
MNMNKPIMILVMLVLTAFVGMMVRADLADAFKRTPSSAHSSITNHTGTTNSTSKDSTTGAANSTNYDHPEPTNSKQKVSASGDGNSTPTCMSSAEMGILGGRISGEFRPQMMVLGYFGLSPYAA